MVLAESKLTSKRQITLPKSVLHYLGLNPGDPIVFKKMGGRIELTARSKFSIEDLTRKYRVTSSKKASDDEIRKASEDVWISR
jgi:AbrB family looped-hinge helix DNA binding protein